MAQSAIAVADHELAAAAVPVTAAEVRDDLLELFGSVPDGRSGQGRDHPVTCTCGPVPARLARRRRRRSGG